MVFLTEKTRDSMLFPRPLDGATVQITPPGLTWLPAEGAADYRVEIRGDGGAPVYEKVVGADPVHLPDKVLEPGDYTWDVVALDDGGREAARRGEQRFSIAPGVPELPWPDPEELLARVPAGHSRLLYPKADLPEIRATLETTRKRSWQACLRAADRALDTDVPVSPDYHLREDRHEARLAYKDYFAYFRGFVDSNLMHLALGYLMTEEAKYADAAKRILLEIARWPTDDADVTSVSAKWGDEPGLSFSKCAHFAYDWLYEALSDAEKALVLKMCEERAWQTYRRLKDRTNYLTCPGSSHDGRLIAYLSDMAIVMAGESEGATTWLEYSLRALTTIYPHWAGHEGGWAEGTPYGLWYNGFYIPAFEGLRQTTGFDLWQRPFFRNVRYFFFYCTAVRGEIRPFGDSAETGGPGVKGGSGYANLMWHHAHRFSDPHMGWWVNQIRGWSGGGDRTSLLFEDEPPSAPPTDLPQSRAFRGVGWAGLHGDLADPERVAQPRGPECVRGDEGWQGPGDSIGILRPRLRGAPPRGMDPHHEGEQLRAGERRRAGDSGREGVRADRGVRGQGGDDVSARGCGAGIHGQAGPVRSPYPVPAPGPLPDSRRSGGTRGGPVPVDAARVRRDGAGRLSRCIAA